MAIFPHSTWLALALLPALSAAQGSGTAEPISLDAESSTFDGKRNEVVFRGLHIQQGDMSIRADLATASSLDFAASEWTFDGHLKIEIDSAVLEADRAKLVFSDHHLVSAALEGKPASIEDEGGEQPVRGGANHVDYNEADQTLRLTDGAWLSQGQNEIKGCDLVYDLKAERVASGSSDCGEPVRITILPPSEGGENDSAGAP